MSKKWFVAVSLILVLAFLVGLSILFAKIGVFTSADDPSSTAEDTIDNTASEGETDETTVETRVEIPVRINNNSAEYDLKAILYANKSNETFLSLEYYVDGKSVKKDIGSSEMPEIEALLQKRSASSASGGYGVNAIDLNRELAKAYITIEGRPFNDNCVETAIYSYDLRDSRLNRIFAEIGNFSDILFNKDSTLMAFSYKDSSVSSKHQENSLVQILDMETDELIVTDSRNTDGARIGNDLDTELVYDYTVKSWFSDTAIILLRQSWSASGSGEGTEPVGKDVIYDVTGNVFINEDGSVMEDNAKPSPAPTPTPADTAQVKTLKLFYSYSSSMDNYSKAMNLLDDSFTIELSILRPFGVDKLTKADLTPESVSYFKDLLKTAKLEKIVKEDNSVKDISTISYYQTFSLEEGVNTTLPLVATLKRSGGSWKIFSIIDGNPLKPPFSN